MRSRRILHQFVRFLFRVLGFLSTTGVDEGPKTTGSVWNSLATPVCYWRRREVRGRGCGGEGEGREGVRVDGRFEVGWLNRFHGAYVFKICG